MYRLKSLTIFEHPRVECSPENPVVLNFHDGANLILGVNGSGKTTLLKLIEGVCNGEFETNLLQRSPLRMNAVFHYRGVHHPIGNATIEVDFQTNPKSRIAAQGGDDENTGRFFDSVAGEIDRKVNVKITVQNGSQFTIACANELVNYFDATQEFAQFAAPPPAAHGGKQSAFRHLVHNRYIMENPNLAQPLRIARSLFVDSSHAALRCDEHLSYFNRIQAAESGFHLDMQNWANVLLLQSIPRASHITGTSWEYIVFGEVPEKLQLQLEQAVKVAGLASIDDTTFDCTESISPFKAVTGVESVTVRYAEPRSGSEFNRFYGRAEFTITWPNGVTHPASDLSFGQKRLLAFLWMVHTHTHGPVLCDELANGLHWEWVQECIKEIGDRQSFHAVQNPLMINELVESDADVIRKQLILCSRGKDGKFIWKQPTAEEAEEISRAAKRLVRPVSEQLAGMGLW